MATQKRPSAGTKKRAPAKKPSRPAAKSAKSAPAASRGRNSAAAKASREAQIKQHSQVMAVVLFAMSLFLFSLVLIDGESVWRWLHNVVLGLFGFSAILWPILMLYVSIMTALEKTENRLKTKIWLTVIIIILFCSAIYIFNTDTAPKDTGYFDRLIKLYESGVNRQGAGFFSGLLGYPLFAALGNVGSKIVILLLLFVAIMILTGTSLITLFRTVTKPMDSVRDNIDTARQRKLEERGRANIDIALDDDGNGMPAHTVTSGRPPKKPVNHEKRDKLMKVFGAGEPEPDEKTPLKAPETDSAADSAAAAAAAFAAFNTKPVRKEDLVPKQPDPQTVPVQLSLFTDDSGKDENYRFPPTSMLEETEEPDVGDVAEELKINGEMLVNTLKSFGVQTKIVDISRGPAVTRYELQPAAGVKISRITNLADDIALNLAAAGVRIEAPIPGKAAVGIEVPNKKVSVVRMRELIGSQNFSAAKSRLTVALGRDIAGNVTLADLAKMPHVLIAGATGSGKSVCINSLIISLLYKASPDEVRFLMVDPKVVELGIYNGIPHLLVPVVTDPRKAAGALGWAVSEMLDRYKTFAECNVRDLTAYNRLVAQNATNAEGEPLEHMPQIVIIIDELADLMMAAPNEVEDSICRLAQMARAAGMHLVIATQRPSVDVITGIIKANIPSRIAFAVSSQVDSRTILDMGGAEKLLGRGDMLFSPVGSSKPIRVQGCFVSDAEIENIVDFVKKAQESGYDENIIQEIEKNAVVERDKGSSSDDTDEDPMMQEAIKCVVEAGQASTSLLQRRLRLGYARAGRLIDQMEQMGVVGPHEGSKPRQVLITYQQWLEMNMQKADKE